MYFLGIDAGGTKTEAVIVDVDGEIVSQGKGGSANYHNDGLVHAIESVKTAAKQALNAAEISADKLTSSCIGIASFDTPRDRGTLQSAFAKFQKKFFGDRLTILNDAVIGLYSGSRPPGICLISGTGSNCYGVGPKGKEAFAGDWSYLLGDQGGGYHLALRILRSIMRAFDGRGENTVLRDLVFDRLGITHEYDLVEWVYHKNPTPGEVAALGSLLDHALAKRDAVAKNIFTEQINQLCTTVEAVIHRVGLKDSQFDVVLIGSFFKTTGAVDAIRGMVRGYCRGASFVHPTVSAAVGAAQFARGKIKEI